MKAHRFVQEELASALRRNRIATEPVSQPRRTSCIAEPATSCVSSDKSVLLEHVSARSVVRCAAKPARIHSPTITIAAHAAPPVLVVQAVPQGFVFVGMGLLSATTLVLIHRWTPPTVERAGRRARATKHAWLGSANMTRTNAVVRLAESAWGVFPSIKESKWTSSEMVWLCRATKWRSTSFRDVTR